jgi:hypothetical protein
VLPRHASDVEESHDDVTQGSAEIADEAEYSLSPNCSPVTVTDPRPENGTFAKAKDATGPSNVNASVAVPTSPPTVTCTARIASYTLPSASHRALARQATLVAELHELVEHTPDKSCPVDVCSYVAKFSPVTVTDPIPDGGTFCFT